MFNRIVKTRHPRLKISFFKKKSLNILITVLTNFLTKKEKKKKEKQQSINILITVLTYLPVKA